MIAKLGSSDSVLGVDVVGVNMTDSTIKSGTVNKLCNSVGRAEKIDKVLCSPVFTRIVYNSDVKYKNVQGLFAKGNKLKQLKVSRRSSNQNTLYKDLVVSKVVENSNTQCGKATCNSSTLNVGPDKGGVKKLGCTELCTVCMQGWI